MPTSLFPDRDPPQATPPNEGTSGTLETPPDTAAKYSDRVSPEFKMAMDMVTSSYHTMKLVEDQLRKIDEGERTAHSILHITDPTLYKDMINSKRFKHTLATIRAALAFIKAIDTVKEDVLAENAHA